MTTLHHGNCVTIMADMPEHSVDAVVCDPPYELGFMGKAWDSTGVAYDPETWRAALRVLKPGGHLLAFGGTRTAHRLAVAVEDAGFEIRDSIAWLYGSGFSKSWNFSTMFKGEWCSCPTANAVPYNHASDPDLLRLRGDLHPSTLARGEGEDPGLLPPMQRSSARAGMGEARAQGSGGLVGRDGGARSSINARGEQPSMEGRLVHRAGQGVPDDSQAGPPQGAGERVRGGTSPSDGGDDRETGPTSRGSAPHQRGPGGQPTGEPTVVPRSHEPLDDGALRNGPVCARCGGLDPAYKGFGTGIKPAHEPIVVARKPLEGTVAANVLAHGTGALNIDGCRIEAQGRPRREVAPMRGDVDYHGAVLSGRADGSLQSSRAIGVTNQGRWPANVVLDEDQAAALDQQSGNRPGGGGASRFFYVTREEPCKVHGIKRCTICLVPEFGVDNMGERFKYVAKAPKNERPVVDGVAHPTVKPLSLMRWLVRLVTPPLVSTMVCLHCDKDVHGMRRGVSGELPGVRGCVSAGRQRAEDVLEEVRGHRGEALTESVRVVRGGVSADDVKGQVLFEGMRGEGVGAGEAEGSATDSEGLRPAVRTGTPDGNADGLPAGASQGGSRVRRPDAAPLGSRPPHQRGQGRQPSGKPGDSDKARTRQDSEACAEADRVPPLRRQDRGVGTCATCGSDLQLADRPGVVLDPFAGSGTTIEAAILEGFTPIGIEQDETYLPLIRERIRRCQQQPGDPGDPTLFEEPA